MSTVTTTPRQGRVRAVQELRRSGAAGVHRDRRKRRLRTRGAQNRRAIAENY